MLKYPIIMHIDSVLKALYHESGNTFGTSGRIDFLLNSNIERDFQFHRFSFQ